MYIFCGSQTIGMMNSGITVDKVLEINDDMPNQNSYHFIKNYPNIPVIIPSEWNNENYINNLKNENYDLLFANNPCSGLSLINKNANVNQPANKYFFQVFNMINNIKPKMFLLENAPTLISIGLPILKHMANLLSNYNFTIVRDYAGNHGVCMKRLRTLVVGYKKELTNDKVVLFQTNKKSKTVLKNIIGDLYDKPIGSLKNHEVLNNHKYTNLIPYYNKVEIKSSILRAYLKDYEFFKDKLTEEQTKEYYTRKAKLESGGNIWDKTPYRPSENDVCGSISSVTNYIHPILDRDFTIREYARLMGYPDDFEFFDGGKTPIIQCIAQGVPVKFIEYIANEIKETFNGNRQLINGRINYQHNTANKYQVYNDINNIEKFESKIKI